MMTFLWLIFRCLWPDMSKSVTFLFFVLQDPPRSEIVSPAPFSEADTWWSVVISPMAPITSLHTHERSSYQSQLHFYYDLKHAHISHNSHISHYINVTIIASLSLLEIQLSIYWWRLVGFGRFPVHFLRIIFYPLSMSAS